MEEVGNEVASWLNDSKPKGVVPDMHLRGGVCRQRLARSRMDVFPRSTYIRPFLLLCSHMEQLVDLWIQIQNALQMKMPRMI
jgi:hypothetical protein